MRSFFVTCLRCNSSVPICVYRAILSSLRKFFHLLTSHSLLPFHQTRPLKGVTQSAAAAHSVFPTCDREPPNFVRVGGVVGAKSPFRFFRETTHPSLGVCVPLRRPCTCRNKYLVSSGLRQPVIFHVDQKPYSANPILPFEQPVTRITFDSVLADMSMRRVKPGKFRCEGFPEGLGHM